MFKIKDSDRLTYTRENIMIKACDVDSDGNVENIDIIIDGNLVWCINTQNLDEKSQIIACLFKELMMSGISTAKI